jgi:hypothetical protein
VRVLLGSKDAIDVPIGAVGACASATWVDHEILVTGDDCDGNNVHGILFDLRGRVITSITHERPLDTRDAFLVTGTDRAAIVAPRAYAMVLLELPEAKQQQVVDLVPIQAQATSTPSFGAKQLPSGDWLVASTSGGVGIVDRTTARISHTWIIPRCEAAP